MAKTLKKDAAMALNKLARKQAICNILKDIAFDLTVCRLENTDPAEYIAELKQEIDNVYYSFKQNKK